MKHLAESWQSEAASMAKTLASIISKAAYIESNGWRRIEMA
jgi:hypothetical protein